METTEESIFEPRENHITTKSSEIVERLCGRAKQDIVRTGVRTDGSPWIMVADGHGKDLVTDALRAQNWDEVMNMEDYFGYIEDMIKELGDTSGSGATMSTVIMAPDGFHCKWRGDSVIKIFEDSTEVFSARPHNMHHEEEATRMQSFVAEPQAFNILVLSPTELTMEPSNYYNVGMKINRYGSLSPDNIAMTNALGHNGGSGGIAEEEFIPKKEGVEYSVVVATDGLWDMICDDDEGLIATSSAEELADIATNRWEQEWDYTYPNPRVYKGTELEYTIETKKQKMGADQKDDIGIAVWRGAYS
tara:strand:+ start:268 stop:1179 length:912 start_codon:yes stop_codon:yes gene_type:complete